jgi:hypothetical protein
MSRLGGEFYLGDGLYVRAEGEIVWLRAPRFDVDHEVALDPEVLAAFEAWLARQRGGWKLKPRDSAAFVQDLINPPAPNAALAAAAARYKTRGVG